MERIEGPERLDYRPKSRNKTIVDVLLRRKLMDKRGSGILRMRQDMKVWGIPEPEYIIDEYWTKIIFKPCKAEIILSETIKDRAELNNRQITAVNYVFEHNSITNEVYQKINNIGRTTTKAELRQLAEKGVFDVRGIGKGTYYVLSMTIK